MFREKQRLLVGTTGFQREKCRGQDGLGCELCILRPDFRAQVWAPFLLFLQGGAATGISGYTVVSGCPPCLSLVPCSAVHPLSLKRGTVPSSDRHQSLRWGLPDIASLWSQGGQTLIKIPHPHRLLFTSSSCMQSELMPGCVGRQAVRQKMPELRSADGKPLRADESRHLPSRRSRSGDLQAVGGDLRGSLSQSLKSYP